jgi:monoamine oxidase
VLGGADTLLLEARDRLGGRTWTQRWNDTDIAYRRSAGERCVVARLLGPRKNHTN